MSIIKRIKQLGQTGSPRTRNTAIMRRANEPLVLSSRSTRIARRPDVVDESARLRRRLSGAPGHDGTSNRRRGGRLFVFVYGRRRVPGRNKSGRVGATMSRHDLKLIYRRPRRARAERERFIKRLPRGNGLDDRKSMAARCGRPPKTLSSSTCRGRDWIGKTIWTVPRRPVKTKTFLLFYFHASVPLERDRIPVFFRSGRPPVCSFV